MKALKKHIYDEKNGLDNNCRKMPGVMLGGRKTVSKFTTYPSITIFRI